LDRTARAIVTTTLGEWLSALYEASFEAYGDEELAELVAVTLLEDQLLRAHDEDRTTGGRAAAA
jgi:hypothetical protein